MVNERNLQKLLVLSLRINERLTKLQPHKYRRKHSLDNI
jgi:hypothetical protein